MSEFLESGTPLWALWKGVIGASKHLPKTRFEDSGVPPKPTAPCEADHSGVAILRPTHVC